MPGISVGCNMIESRRVVASAPPVWTPAALFGVGDQGVWLDSADVAYGTDPIALWPNRAGGWPDITQVYPAERPSPGGPAWDDGVPTVLTTGFESMCWGPSGPPVNYFTVGTYTCLWVGRQTGFNYSRLFSGSGTTASHRLWLNGSPTWKAQSRQVNNAGTVVSAVGPSFVRDTNSVVGWQMRASNGCFSLNGSPWSAEVPFIPAGPFTATNYCLLAWTDGSGGLEGYTRSMFIISRNLTDAETAQFSAYYGH